MPAADAAHRQHVCAAVVSAECVAERRQAAAEPVQGRPAGERGLRARPQQTGQGQQVAPHQLPLVLPGGAAGDRQCSASAPSLVLSGGAAGDGQCSASAVTEINHSNRALNSAPVSTGDALHVRTLNVDE